MSATIRRIDDGATITFDAVPSATIGRSISVTRYPVEEGVDLSDHARRMPTEARFDAVVSETPTGNGLRVAAPNESGEGRLRDVIAFLDACVGREIEIIFPRVLTLGPVMLTGSPFPLTAEKMLTFDISVVEIKKVSARSIAMSRVSAPRSRHPDTEAKVDKGTQPTTETKKPTALRSLSDLFGITTPAS